jgi:hypothetical protein
MLRTVIAVVALFLTVGSVACGGDGQVQENCSADDFECRDDVASTETFTARCKKVRDCIGESNFKNTYASMEGCIETFEAVIDSYDQSCKELWSDLYYCTLDNFTCNQGNYDFGPECDDEDEEFSMQCSN